MSSSVQRQQREPWRNQERHYCIFCNAWMGSDRQSILLHENGRKHKDNVEKAMQRKRDEKKAQSKAARQLQKSLEAVQRAAVEAHFQDVDRYGEAAVQRQIQQHQVQSDQNHEQQSARSALKSKKEKSEWESTKRKREAEKRKPTEQQEQVESKNKKRKLKPDEGHYAIDDKVYLEGPAFGDLLEEDMAIQIWIGSKQATEQEQKLPGKNHLWRDAILIKLRRDGGGGGEGEKTADVSYLPEGTADEEMIEKSVPLERIRMLLGGDDKLPTTLQEALLSANGEQVVKVQQYPLEVDENTGLSVWGTVEVRTTTVNNQVRQEREEARQRRKEEALRQKEEQRRLEERRMEEAKVESKEDSALGAYELQGGYRGVNVSNEPKLSMQDTAKSLSDGKTVVGFKNKKGKKKKKANRRSTSSED